MSLDLVGMLLLSLLLMTGGGGDPQSIELVLDGQQVISEHDGGLIVVAADVVIPAGAEVSGPLHVIGGTTRIAGTVSGGVTQFAGAVVVEGGATVGGVLHHVGGTLEVAPAADVHARTTTDFAPEPGGSPLQRFAPVALLTAVLAILGARRAGKTPARFATAGAAATRHPLVSTTVGGLVVVTFLSLFTFMAFTLVLLPVALLGLLVGVVMLGYGVLVLGYLTGRRIPGWSPGRATAAGVVAVMAALQVLGAIPAVGDLLVIGVLLAAFGAVFLTYFGLQEFRPVALPE